jgi:hypothetical protein
MTRTLGRGAGLHSITTHMEKHMSKRTRSLAALATVALIGAGGSRWSTQSRTHRRKHD